MNQKLPATFILMWLLTRNPKMVWQGNQINIGRGCIYPKCTYATKLNQKLSPHPVSQYIRPHWTVIGWVFHVFIHKTTRTFYKPTIIRLHSRIIHSTLFNSLTQTTSNTEADTMHIWWYNIFFWCAVLWVATSV